ncbi:hypothetical protein, partial [Salmonella enterica]
SLGLQGFGIWFGGVGAGRRRRAKKHQTPVQALLSDIGLLRAPKINKKLTKQGGVCILFVN